jgi:hypothetical protein
MSELTTETIPMCELCRRVCDRSKDSTHSNAWTQLHTYVTRHRLQARHVAFSPSYCHDCLNGYALAATYGNP